MNSDGTHPNDANWPGNWSPIPAHSVPAVDDKVVFSKVICDQILN